MTLIPATITIVAITCAITACAWLIAAAVQAADDSADDLTQADETCAPFLTVTCTCDFNFDGCDWPVCPENPGNRCPLNQGRN